MDESVKDIEKGNKKSGWKPSTWGRKRLIIFGVALILLVLAIGLGVGLGVGLTRGDSSSSSSDDSEGAAPTGSPIPAQTLNGIWQPKTGVRWQIDIDGPLKNTTVDVPVYDIDMFENTAETISGLKSQGRKVICYFSAGSYEDWRSDKSDFDQSTDLGKPLAGWEGEYWLNTKSDNVRKIMQARLNMAVTKGCDGVDPDNIDAYENDNGLGLTQSDAINYVGFLADEGHARNLSVGLKNGGDIIDQVVGKLQWVVNEQCLQYSGDCEQLEPFIEQGKPVFHIEYPDKAPDVSANSVAQLCGDNKGFSSVLKIDGNSKGLNDWLVECPMF